MDVETDMKSVVESMFDVYEERRRLQQMYLSTKYLRIGNYEPDAVSFAKYNHSRPIWEFSFDVNEASERGITALMVAADLNAVHVASVLLNGGADLTKIAYDDKRFTTAMLLAVSKDHHKIVDMLLDHLEDPNGTVEIGGSRFPILSVAIDKQATKSLEHLVQYGVNVNAIDDQSLAALHRVCLSIPRESCTSTSKEAALTMLRYLVDVLGIDVNIKGFMGLAPLHIAVHSGCLDAVTILVEAGADITVQDDNGRLPDMYSRCEDHEILKYLSSCKGQCIHLLFGRRSQLVLVYKLGFILAFCKSVCEKN